MKKLVTMFALLGISLFVTSCMKDMPDSLSGYIVSKDEKGAKDDPVPENNDLKVYVESLNFSSNAGNQSFNVTSNVNWRVSCEADWVTVTESTTRGSGNGTVTVSVKENSGVESRTATVIVNAGDLSQTIAVTQVGATPVNQSTRTFTVNGVIFNMILVEGGTFTIESTSEQVTLSNYYIGETEVTQELWQAVMGSNPSYFSGSRKPVECVSWNDCQIFINKLNALTGQNFRLPTEAEWHFAARGGNNSRGYKYAGSNTIDDVAWYKENSNGETHDVAQKSPNELGLYDMSGNVWEWSSKGPISGSFYMCYGGSWKDEASSMSLSSVSQTRQDFGDSSHGLRLTL